MSPNVIKHRKTIQTSVVKANLASNCLPEPVWVVVTKTGTFLRENWDISAPKLGHFCAKTGTFLHQNWDISAPKLGHFCPKT